jgi:F-type H+-transporting ATPase subunit gamma
VSRDGDFRRQLAGLGSLYDAVSAMSSLSAHHLHQVRAALPPAADYQAQLADALACAGVQFPGAGTGETLLVVVGSQLGLCGGYNGRVAALAAQRRAELGPGPTIAVGRRLAGALGRRDVPLADRLVGITSLTGVPPLVLTLARTALLAHRGQSLHAVELVSARYRGVGEDEPTATRILPLTLPTPSGPPLPVAYVAPDQLVDEASRELLYVSLMTMIIDALAAEHASRLLATRSAGDWLSDRIEKVQRQQRAARQESSTQETLEVAAAARQRSS